LAFTFLRSRPPLAETLSKNLLPKNYISLYVYIYICNLCIIFIQLSFDVSAELIIIQHFLQNHFFQNRFARGGLDLRNVNVNINFCRHFPANLSALCLEMLIRDPVEVDVGVQRSPTPPRQ